MCVRERSLSIYFNCKKIYWSTKYIKKAHLYPKMQKIKMEKTKYFKLYFFNLPD